MQKTVDGFPIQDSFDWLPTKPDPSLNPWSYGKTIQVEVWGDWWFDYIHHRFAKVVHWKGKSIWVQDYDWFTSLIKQAMTNKFYPKTKEEALDEWFEMELWSFEYARKNSNYRREIQEWYDMQKPLLAQSATS